MLPFSKQLCPPYPGQQIQRKEESAIIFCLYKGREVCLYLMITIINIQKENHSRNVWSEVYVTHVMIWQSGAPSEQGFTDFTVWVSVAQSTAVLTIRWFTYAHQFLAGDRRFGKIKHRKNDKGKVKVESRDYNQSQFDEDMYSWSPVSSSCTLPNILRARCTHGVNGFMCRSIGKFIMFVSSFLLYQR